MINQSDFYCDEILSGATPITVEDEIVVLIR